MMMTMMMIWGSRRRRKTQAEKSNDPNWRLGNKYFKENSFVGDNSVSLTRIWTKLGEFFLQAIGASYLARISQKQPEILKNLFFIFHKAWKTNQKKWFPFKECIYFLFNARYANLLLVTRICCMRQPGGDGSMVGGRETEIFKTKHQNCVHALHIPSIKHL